MRVAAIIAEYNPFHNGHAYQIMQVKRQTGCDFLVVVMSGDFVQRGEPAIVDKYCRAEMALRCGADLVLELPVYFATGSAPYFAEGGVSILHSLGCVDVLAFGTEVKSGSAEMFYETARYLLDEPKEYKQVLARELRNGLSFPAARQLAIAESLPGNDKLLRTPNNILGLEYTKALLEKGSEMEILPLPRVGEGYHSEVLQHFSSATAIRKAMEEGKKDIREMMPEEAFAVLTEYLSQKKIICADDLTRILGYRLLQCKEARELQAYYDIGEFLANRMFQKQLCCQSFTQFAALLKTKNETLLHMNRALLHLILDLKDTNQTKNRPYYTRILGMKKSASPLLRRIKEVSRIPVLTKLGNADQVLEGFSYREGTAEYAKAQLRETSFASNLYQMILSEACQSECKHEYTRQFKVL